MCCLIRERYLNHLLDVKAPPYNSRDVHGVSALPIRSRIGDPTSSDWWPAPSELSNAPQLDVDDAVIRTVDGTIQQTGSPANDGACK